MDTKTIVLTMYGTGENIKDLTVTLFHLEPYLEKIAKDYCTNINELELKGDNWIYSFIVKENEKIRIENPLKCDFDIINKLDDRSIQKVIREAENNDLKKALKSAKKETFKAILRNMSKRAAKMFVEDMIYMGPVRSTDVNEARRKIVNIIRHMEDIGEINGQWEEV